MKHADRRWLMVAGAGFLLAGLSAWSPPARVATAGGEPPADPALERARDHVKMLDDLYKTAVVSVTTRYVDKQNEQPAIKVAKDVFGAMGKRRWHSARLVDATGEPLSDLNAPRTDFEKDAARAVNAGQTYFERVVGEGKDRRLLAATVVPVVMQKCADCHTHKKVGEVLGFIRYDVPVR
jgi:Protein of unknown function (DUF3365)